MNTRALAAKIITDVFVQGKSLTAVLEEHQGQLSNPKDSALLQELCFGVARWWWRYDAVLSHLMDKPLKKKDSDIKHLVMTGLHQLMDMRIPDHAAVAETVSACDELEKSWAKKLVNALLRNYQRNNTSITNTLKQDPDFQYSHPDWLLRKIKQDWPDHWQQILEANNQKPPMVVRVNQKKITREEYLYKLANINISATEFEYCEDGLILATPIAAEKLPGFEHGWVSIQDGAAQLAAGQLQLAQAARVLDVCAAPGGKAAHILEVTDDNLDLTALDVDAVRLEKVADNMKRLGLSATILEGDAQKPEQWWGQQVFDRILLDAPCSATGVIRRHPDIKQLRRAADIQQLVKQQATILHAVWPLLASRGMLLYATCSILPDENEEQIAQFLQSHNDAVVVENDASWGIKQAYGRQILPGQDNMDGFYYACLRKQ